MLYEYKPHDELALSLFTTWPLFDNTQQSIRSSVVTCLWSHRSFDCTQDPLNPYP